VRVTDPEEPSKYKQLNVAHLVLSAFVGGYYYQRNVNYKDGNRSNCKLSNLEWKSGFQNGIDYEYLSNLNDDKMEYGDIVAKKVLLNKQDWMLINYISENKGYFYKIYKEDIVNKPKFSDFLDLVYENSIKSIKNGKYIPLQKGSKKYKDKDSKRINKDYDLFLLWLRRNCGTDRNEPLTIKHEFISKNQTTSDMLHYETHNLRNSGSPDDDAINEFALISNDPIWG
jgi:hypothetical protein